MADETKEGTEDQGTQENEADENQVQAAKFTYEQAIADPEIKREIDKVRDQAVTQGIQTFQENQAKKALDAQEEAKKRPMICRNGLSRYRKIFRALNQKRKRPA